MTRDEAIDQQYRAELFAAGGSGPVTEDDLHNLAKLLLRRVITAEFECKALAERVRELEARPGNESINSLVLRTQNLNERIRVLEPSPVFSGPIDGDPPTVEAATGWVAPHTDAYRGIVQGRTYPRNPYSQAGVDGTVGDFSRIVVSD